MPSSIFKNLISSKMEDKVECILFNSQQVYVKPLQEESTVIQDNDDVADGNLSKNNSPINKSKFSGSGSGGRHVSDGSIASDNAAIEAVWTVCAFLGEEESVGDCDDEPAACEDVRAPADVSMDLDDSQDSPTKDIVFHVAGFTGEMKLDVEVMDDEEEDYLNWRVSR